MKPVVLLDSKQFNITINRLCHQLIENHGKFENAVIIGLQPRGVYLANRIRQELQTILGNGQVQCGRLDTTFHRDDFGRRETPVVPKITDIDFEIEDKDVILVDDVMYTGRTIRSGLDAMLAFGRPRRVELLVLIERRFSRHLPISPDYVGKWVDSIAEERVEVEWSEIEGKDKVILTQLANE